MYIFISQYTPLVHCSLHGLHSVYRACFCCCFFQCLFFSACQLATFRIYLHISLHFNARCVICQVWVSEWVSVFFVLCFSCSNPCLRVLFVYLVGGNVQIFAEIDNSNHRHVLLALFFTSLPVCKTIRTRALTFLFNLETKRTAHGVQNSYLYISIVTLALFL